MNLDPYRGTCRREACRASHDAPLSALDDAAAEWVIRESSDDPIGYRTAETVCTVGAHGLGTRGPTFPSPTSTPLVVAQGVYTGAGWDEHLLAGPEWMEIDLTAASGVLRTLDLRHGCLEDTFVDERGAASRAVRFVSAARPGVVALRVGSDARFTPGPALRLPREADGTDGRTAGRDWWARTSGSHGGGIVAVAHQRTWEADAGQVVERIAAYGWSSREAPRIDAAKARLDAAKSAGFNALFAEHRATWLRRWADVDVEIPGDAAAQLGIRYALFQLWCNASGRTELAVGARGVSGAGYSGHVFWDTDAFVLPAMSSIDPPSGSAMVGYRMARLDAAVARGMQEVGAGARFPWESALDGTDVTPRTAVVSGHIVPILTGLLEEHISADVTWGAVQHARWSGRNELLGAELLPLLVQTARFWTRRIRETRDGSAHIFGVIGPDEYHESVDDNAFTNGMAAWNLRTAADAADRASGPTPETANWRRLADELVTGLDTRTGRYEQFAGYLGLERLDLTTITSTPVAADLLLGHDRVAASQIIKQPDALMLHFLLPDEQPVGSLEANLAFYGPRTAHGSSLSPAVMACLHARAGQTAEAKRLLDVALGLDLHDASGMASAGLHLANLAGVWIAFLTGFVGVSVQDDVLRIAPHLPPEWPTVHVRFRCLGARVRLTVTDDAVEIGTDTELRVRYNDGATRTVFGTHRLTADSDVRGAS